MHMILIISFEIRDMIVSPKVQRKNKTSIAKW